MKGKQFIKRLEQHGVEIIKDRGKGPMDYHYPVHLTRLDNGSVMAEFRDLPEALTHGADDDNALSWACDALLVALSGYLDERRSIPVPF